MRSINKLSAIEVERKAKPGRYGDGGGLYLQVSSSGAKSWLFRYMIHGKAHEMGLGSVQAFSLKEARERAKQPRQLVADGVDPIEAKHSERSAKLAAQAKQITFSDAAEAYIRAHSAGWRNVKHADQWRNTLKAYAAPTIGRLSVADVDTSHMVSILEPIWTAKTETASRVRGRIEKVLDWATARKYRAGDNPARWRGHLDNLLARPAKVASVRHHPALPYAALPSLLVRLRDLDGVSPRALEFTILTAARTGETIGARWHEIDLAAKVWTVPGERMKSGREHRVPLSDTAIELLTSLPTEAEFVFPGARSKRPLSNMAMLETLRGLNIGDVTVHGFRSTFRDWAGEQTNFPREIAETALAHVVVDKTEAAYRRGDALEKRRRLMDAWAKFCGSSATPPVVVPLRVNV